MNKDKFDFLIRRIKCDLENLKDLRISNPEYEYRLQYEIPLLEWVFSELTSQEMK